MKRKSYGFTIIEVAVVLAIAGLIIALVFVGVGQANKASRDAKRKQDANYLATVFEQWAQNNNGEMPAPLKVPPDFTLTNGSIDPTSPIVEQNYLELPKFKDPLTENSYQIGYNAAAFDPSSTCPSSIDPALAAKVYIQPLNGREAKIYMCLESGYYEVER